MCTSSIPRVKQRFWPLKIKIKVRQLTPWRGWLSQVVGLLVTTKEIGLQNNIVIRFKRITCFTSRVGRHKKSISINRQNIAKHFSIYPDLSPHTVQHKGWIWANTEKTGMYSSSKAQFHETESVLVGKDNWLGSCYWSGRYGMEGEVIFGGLTCRLTYSVMNPVNPTQS